MRLKTALVEVDYPRLVLDHKNHPGHRAGTWVARRTAKNIRR